MRHLPQGVKDLVDAGDGDSSERADFADIVQLLALDRNAGASIFLRDG